MKLTAIKIPGKKKVVNDKAAREARNALKRPAGRPFNFPGPKDDIPSSEISGQPTKRQKKKHLKNMKSKRKMSDFEKLPTEILETIFLFCLNVNLPNASPVIAGKLSSSMVFNKTIMAAFGPTWERWHGRERNRLMKLTQDIEDIEEDPVLQSEILRSRWATLSIVLKAKDIWIENFAQDRDFKPGWFVINNDPPPENDEGQLVPKITAQEYVDTDFRKFSDLILGKKDGGWLWDECSWALNSDVADGIEIPPSLLSGPWDEDMLKYLFWIRKSGAGIDFYNSTSGEIALEGIKKAITFGDIRAIHLLAWVGVVEKLDVNLLVWAFRNAGGDKIAVITQLLRLNFGVMKDKEARRIDKELADMIEEARQDDDDDEKLQLVEKIISSETLDGRLETVGSLVRRS